MLKWALAEHTLKSSEFVLITEYRLELCIYFLTIKRWTVLSCNTSDLVFRWCARANRNFLLMVDSIKARQLTRLSRPKLKLPGQNIMYDGLHSISKMTNGSAPWVYIFQAGQNQTTNENHSQVTLTRFSVDGSLQGWRGSAEDQWISKTLERKILTGQRRKNRWLRRLLLERTLKCCTRYLLCKGYAMMVEAFLHFSLNQRGVIGNEDFVPTRYCCDKCLSF